MLNLENIKKSSVYITPNFPSLQTRRYKFKFTSLLGVLAVYSFIVTVVIITILALTPAKEIIFILENEKLQEQGDRINLLEQKIGFLSEELNEMHSINKRLKFAMILADTGSFDSTAAIYDSLRKFTLEEKVNEGNLFRVFNFIIELFSDSPGNPGEQFFIKPINGVVTNTFDPGAGHLGVDYAAPEGAPVFASAGGTVIFSGYIDKDGYTIIVKHKADYLSIYKHCSVLVKQERESVRGGEVLALCGNTGYNTTGPHLHFEIWKNNRQINPLEILINE